MGTQKLALFVMPNRKIPHKTITALINNHMFIIW